MTPQRMPTSRILPFRGLGMALIVFCLGAPTSAQQQPAFEMVRPPPLPPGIAAPQIIGGRPSVLSDWRATFKYESVRGPCTSTVIGPRVVLTAAHCVMNGAVGKLKVGSFSTRLTCNRHPDYDGPNSDLDIALCLADDQVPLEQGAPFERLNADALKPAADEWMLLQGTGCRQVGGGGPLGFLFEGDAKVQVPAHANASITTAGGPATCSGDSGGAAFSRSQLSRRVVGVNSKSDLSRISVLVSVAHPAVRSFVVQWALEKQVSVCGLDPNAVNCHA